MQSLRQGAKARHRPGEHAAAAGHTAGSVSHPSAGYGHSSGGWFLVDDAGPLRLYRGGGITGHVLELGGGDCLAAGIEPATVTARGTWKAEERRIADDLGGKRIPVSGLDRDGADVVTPLFLVQSKLRRALPAWLWAWLNPIAADAHESGRIGILVLRTPRMLKADSLVVIKYSDFRALHGVVTPETGTE